MSDASGSWGCDAFTSAGEWFQLELPSSWDGIHITIKELLPSEQRYGAASGGECLCGACVTMQLLWPLSTLAGVKCT